MKASWKLWLILVSLFFLPGCWDRVELNDLSLITALAFDQAENNQIQVTIQFVIPQNQSGGGLLGGGGGSGGDKRTTVRSEKGADIAHALSKLQRIMPRKLFWGQCKVFIFSEEVAKRGIKEHFDFLLRHPQPRESAYMFVSKGKAADALELFPPIERSSSEVLRELDEFKVGPRITMEQLSIRFKGDSQAAVLPLVYILPRVKSAEPLQSIPFMLGTAIFKKDKMIGDMSEKITRGLQWVNNDIGEYTVTFPTEESEGLISLKPVKAHVKRIPRIEGDKWTMTVKVRTEGDMIQNGTSLNPMSPELLDKMDKAFKKDVHDRIRLALREAQQRWKADVFDFAKDFHRKYPKRWDQAKDRWDELFPKVEVFVEVQAEINRLGLINSPGGIPKTEVKEK